MKILNNEDGIALVTSLMLTLISLVMVMTLLYFVTRGTEMSASQKRYRTALEASHGGVELFAKDIMPKIFQGYSSSLGTDFAAISLQMGSGACLNNKLKKAPSTWGATCSTTDDPKTSPDVSFVLQSNLAGFDSQAGFKVFGKIVDTVVGNSDTSGIQLDGTGVAEGSSTITPIQIPYVYRIEVLGERANNPKEKAALSILYAY